MNNRTIAIAIAFFTTLCIPAQAQTVEELREEVQRSVCQSDWHSALSTVNRLIGSGDISSDYRNSLLQYRRQIQSWQASNTVIDTTVAECQPYQMEERSEATESPDAAFTQPDTLNWDSAVTSISSEAGNPVEPTESESICDPSYPDICLQSDIDDLDCSDIPYRRFRVLSPDPHRFDGDLDGVGCEW